MTSTAKQTEGEMTARMLGRGAGPGFRPPGEFARRLRRKLGDYARGGAVRRFADRWQWAQIASVLLIGTGTYVSLVSGAAEGSYLAAAGLVAVSAFACFMMLVVLGHDAAHGSASSRKWVNEAAVFGVFAVLGVSGALWRDRHLRLHHPYPNVAGTGIDADSANVVRLAPDKPRHWYHRLQPLYAVMLYSIGLVQLVWVDDFITFRAERRARPKTFGGTRQVLAFAGSKLLHLALFVGLPIVVGGFDPLSVAAGYFFATAIVSLCFATLVIGTHVSDLAVFPEVGADGRLPHDWATHQLVTSVDWSPFSRLAAAMTGGANAHTAHHLFPGWAHSHAAALLRIVVEAARESGLNYRATSFAGMVGGHLRHVLDMARPAPGASAA